MSLQKLLVIGAGGFGRAVAEAVEASGKYTLIGFVDDRWPDLSSVSGLPILGNATCLPSLREWAEVAVVAVGNNQRRRALFELIIAAGFFPASVVHPRAIVSPSAMLGEGVTVMAGAIVGCESRLENGVIASAGCVIDHHCAVGAFAQLSTGACLPGGSSLGAEAWLQEGCVLGPGEHLTAGQTRKRCLSAQR